MAGGMMRLEQRLVLLVVGDGSRADKITSLHAAVILGVGQRIGLPELDDLQTTTEPWSQRCAQRIGVEAQPGADPPARVRP